MLFVPGDVAFHVFGTISQEFEWGESLHPSYKMVDCGSLDEAWVKVWQNKMRRNALQPPKLCSLPPTEATFRENVLRVHMTMSIWRDCLRSDSPVLNPTKHGWYRPEGKTIILVPVMIPSDTSLAHTELLKLLKCSCSSSKPCSTKRCSCRTDRLVCTIFCHCREEDDCNNK